MLLMNPPSSPASPLPKIDEDGIRDLYRRVMEGWNRGDAAAFAANFAEDGDLVGFDGTHFKGRAEIAAFHQPLFNTHLKGSRLVGEVVDIKSPDEDVAVFHAYGGTIMAGESAPSPSRDSIQTIVAQKHGSTWEIVAFQNTRIRPMGRHAGGTLVWLFSDLLWRIFGPKGRTYSPRPQAGAPR